MSEVPPNDVNATARNGSTLPFLSCRSNRPACLEVFTRKWHLTKITGDVVFELLNDEFLFGDNVFD